MEYPGVLPATDTIWDIFTAIHTIYGILLLCQPHILWDPFALQMYSVASWIFTTIMTIKGLQYSLWIYTVHNLLVRYTSQITYYFPRMCRIGNPQVPMRRSAVIREASVDTSRIVCGHLTNFLRTPICDMYRICCH